MIHDVLLELAGIYGAEGVDGVDAGAGGDVDGFESCGKENDELEKENNNEEDSKLGEDCKLWCQYYLTQHLLYSKQYGKVCNFHIV